MTITMADGDDDSLKSGQYHIRFRNDGQDYWLESMGRVVRDVNRSAPLIVVDLPARVHVSARRRFWRAELHHSTPVTIHWDDDRSSIGELLNLSQGGLACRIATRDLSGCVIGRSAELSFVQDATKAVEIEATCTRQGSHGGERKIMATIRAITPSGDAQYSIVRVEFSEHLSIPDPQ